MPRKSCTKRLQLSVNRFARLFVDRKSLDAEADRAVVFARWRTENEYVRDDPSRDREFRIRQVAGHPGKDFFGIRTRDPKAHLVPLTDERERLPVV